MATTISPAFTAANRRKRIATYGKGSRTTPALNWNDDAPSPERPRKQAGGGLHTLNSAAKTVPNRPITTRDVFDVPSDDELAPRPRSPPARKQPLQKAPPVDEFDVPSSSDDAAPTPRQSGKAPSILRKPASARHPEPIVKSLRRPEKADMTSSDDPIPPPRRRAKTPQLAQKPPNKERKDVQQPKKLPVKPRIHSRATTPAPPTPTTQKKLKSTSALPLKKSAPKPSSELDIFDVPSEDDAPLFSPRRNRPVGIPRAQLPKVTRPLSGQLSPIAIESDDSNASRKRKRHESSQSSAATKEADNGGKDKEAVVAARSTKYQKKTEGVSAGLEAYGFSRLATEFGREPKDPTVNKPKRTRLRTLPGPPRAPVGKGQSSPAKLHGMLAMRTVPKHLPQIQLPEIEAPDDETMYDIPDPATPVPKSKKHSIAASVTPRQKEMFSNLLGDLSDAATSDMPSIRRLRLTDRKPGSLVSSMARSSSDIPQSTHTRKTRLIDTLMQAATSSEQEDSESEEETEEDIVEIRAESKPASNAAYGKLATDAQADSPDDVDMESEAPGHSQTSQSALHSNIGAKVTYAKQRSYVEESNLADGLLLAMDLDDPLGIDGFGSNRRQDPMSEDEDDPASQVRGIHELRRQGENQKFQMEAQTSIDDIADKAGLGKSVRRSAMLEFCTRMGDPKFLGLLLDSALGHQFLASISFTSEIIFDFAACVAVAFILEAQPNPTILEEIHKPDIMASLSKLLELDVDISRIAKDRKTNLSKVGRESVENFRTLVEMSSIWSPNKPEKVTPQIVALRTMELLVLALRKAGSTDILADENVVCKLLDAVTKPCERLRDGKQTSQDVMILHLAFSIMEALSISTEKQITWSTHILQRLVDATTILFNAQGSSPIKLAARLCILLTNNKPKACDTFAGQDFVKSLVTFINKKFIKLTTDVADEGTEVRDDLILSLGAMINIAEFSDQARENVVAHGDELIDALARTFLEGSERAAQANSMEESQANVPVGYLTVFLGNLCLNDVVRRKVRSRLPGQKLDVLVDKVKEFVSFHERVDRMTNQFEGAEGREVSQNYTRRLMQVVKRLEQAES